MMDSGASKEDSRKILCAGLCVLDMMNICKDFPKEDSDQRIVDQLWQRGGNASNTCSVLSLLDADCEYFGTIANAPEKAFLVNDFTENGISMEHCIFLDGCRTPIATCIVNQKTASRTILYCNKNLRELTLTDFKTLPLDENRYKWIHFEGRPTVAEIRKMMEYLNNYNLNVSTSHRISVSVELEKAERDLDQLADLADYVFVSKDRAMAKGYKTMKETVEGYSKITRPGATVICPWGELGASACSSDGVFCHSPAFPPDKLVDTLGAGDTFVAATIFALSNGSPCSDAITFGCKVAGAKCGMMKNAGLKDWYRNVFLKNIDNSP